MTFYLLDTGFKNPYENMAIDEALLFFVEKEKIPLLRFFNFSPPSVTIGYNQKVERWLLHLEKKGVLWVRRRTGGRAVFHKNDLTYSIIFPHNHPLIGGSILESYRKIARIFEKAFDSMGIPVVLERKKGERGTNFCFEASSFYEFTLKGKKIMGSAQARIKGTILQEGTIALKYPGEPFPDVKGMGAIEDVKDISLEEAKSVIVSAFRDVYGIDFIGFDKEIDDIPLDKYSSREWNYRK